MAKKKHHQWKSQQEYQLRFAFPEPPQWHQLSIVFPKHERPASPPPKPFQLVFDGFVNGYERRGIFNREDVLNFLGQERVFGDDVIKLISQRYFLFSENCVCVRCGLEGLYFAKERSAKIVKVHIEGTGCHTIEYRPLNGSSWHLNLYALKRLQDGSIREVLMTKDHIVPRSKGGADNMSNYQTMCAICNGHKGDKLHVGPPVYVELSLPEPEYTLPEIKLVGVE